MRLPATGSVCVFSPALRGAGGSDSWNGLGRSFTSTSVSPPARRSSWSAAAAGGGVSAGAGSGAGAGVSGGAAVSGAARQSADTIILLAL